MQEMLAQGRFQTNDWHYAHIGDLLFTYFMVLSHLNPSQHIRLWHDGERLVGYAVLGEDPAFDWQVLPDYEWRGIEEEALEWAESLLVRLRQDENTSWGGPIVTGARQDQLQRKAFLEQHGFRRGGEFSEVNMICEFNESIPEPFVPDGCRVRSFAGKGELSNRAEAQQDVWQPWTVGNVTDDDYAAFTKLPGYEHELDVVAVAPDGVIASYVNGWIDRVNRVGDFGPVGTRPAYRRQGLARAALIECLRRMRERGMERVSVSTGITNTPAIRLYESVGFQIVNEYHEYVQRLGKTG
jgi:ribosomal protein S18 acetylase RimI-like enzyme